MGTLGDTTAAAELGGREGNGSQPFPACPHAGCPGASPPNNPSATGPVFHPPFLKGCCGAWRAAGAESLRRSSPPAVPRRNITAGSEGQRLLRSGARGPAPAAAGPSPGAAAEQRRVPGAAGPAPLPSPGRRVPPVPPRCGAATPQEGVAGAAGAGTHRGGGRGRVGLRQPVGGGGGAVGAAGGEEPGRGGGPGAGGQPGVGTVEPRVAPLPHVREVGHLPQAEPTHHGGAALPRTRRRSAPCAACDRAAAGGAGPQGRGHGRGRGLLRDARGAPSRIPPVLPSSRCSPASRCPIPVALGRVPARPLRPRSVPSQTRTQQVAPNVALVQPTGCTPS